ncbi:HAD family hydrolase [Xenophilus sp. AP218F]|nr:HAD family hydrolase [Xenophilus sp. AP218F]
MSQTYDLVVFDWDGTLMDSTGHIVQSLQQACRDLDLPVPDYAQASHVIGLRLADALRQACPAVDEARLPALTAAFRQHYLANHDQVLFFDGALACLDAVKARGAFVAVATGNSRAGLNRLLAASGLDDFFDATRTVDECHSKPNPDMLLQIADALGVELKRALMIGDTSHDLQMAQNAGCHGLGVGFGAHPASHLENFGPQAIVHSYDELSSWLLPKLS